MATIYSFGPFQLDDESEILFRGKEPTTVGQRAVAPGQQGRVAGCFRHRAAILSAVSISVGLFSSESSAKAASPAC